MSKSELRDLLDKSRSLAECGSSVFGAIAQFCPGSEDNMKLPTNDVVEFADE